MDAYSKSLVYLGLCATILSILVKRIAVIGVILAACAAPPPPVTAPEPSEVPGREKVIGTVKVTAMTLNVRREATSSSEVIAQVRKGERLALLAAGDEWDRIRLGNGEIGFVSAQHVLREGTRTRRGCAPDADYQFIKTPTPSFSDSSAHGVVTVEANVDVRGSVTSTRRRFAIVWPRLSSSRISVRFDGNGNRNSGHTGVDFASVYADRRHRVHRSWSSSRRERGFIARQRHH
jgi:uncharacterized protein YgiM (DUF1202 family)